MSHPFRDAVEARDLQAMEAVLHPDVVFRSPAVFKPYEGRDDGDAPARAHRRGARGLPLHRRADRRRRCTASSSRPARATGRLQGWDLLELDADGRVVGLTVMIRPITGLLAVAEAMGARLASSKGVGPHIHTSSAGVEMCGTDPYGEASGAARRIPRVDVVILGIDPGTANTGYGVVARSRGRLSRSTAASSRPRPGWTWRRGWRRSTSASAR